MSDLNKYGQCPHESHSYQCCGCPPRESRIEELEAEVERLQRENGCMRQFIYRQAKGIPDPNSAYSVMKTLEAGND